MTQWEIAVVSFPVKGNDGTQRAKKYPSDITDQSEIVWRDQYIYQYSYHLMVNNKLCANIVEFIDGKYIEGNLTITY